MPPPGTTTAGAIVTTCERESDNVNQQFVADPAEWLDYVNASYKELYGLIVQAFGNDYFTQTPSSGYTFTTDGLNQYFALPDTFFKLLGVDLQVSGAPTNWVSLKPFNFSERNNINIINSQVPMAGQTVRLFYVPRCSDITAAGDLIDGVNGWEEYIVADCCIKALAKEESDVSVFMARKKALLERIESEAENRDAGMTGSIADTRGRQSRSMRYRLNGNNLWLIGNGTPGWLPYGDWGGDDGFGGAFW